MANCFLCDPPSDLIMIDYGDFYSLAGLGPIVDGYFILAARKHTKSMADVSPELALQRDSLVQKLRERLVQRYKGCLITEHGKVPVCDEGEDAHEDHCFHAHFLIFPGAPDVSQVAESFFAKKESFSSLADAMIYAAACDEYMLVAPEPGQHNIFSQPLNLPRQLARVLVAAEIGALHLAHWQDYPDRERAKDIAARLKQLFSPV